MDIISITFNNVIDRLRQKTDMYWQWLKGLKIKEIPGRFSRWKAALFDSAVLQYTSVNMRMVVIVSYAIAVCYAILIADLAADGYMMTIGTIIPASMPIIYAAFHMLDFTVDAPQCVFLTMHYGEMRHIAMSRIKMLYLFFLPHLGLQTILVSSVGFSLYRYDNMFEMILIAIWTGVCLLQFVILGLLTCGTAKNRIWVTLVMLFAYVFYTNAICIQMYAPIFAVHMDPSFIFMCLPACVIVLTVLIKKRVSALSVDTIGKPFVCEESRLTVVRTIASVPAIWVGATIVCPLMPDFGETFEEAATMPIRDLFDLLASAPIVMFARHPWFPLCIGVGLSLILGAFIDRLTTNSMYSLVGRLLHTVKGTFIGLLYGCFVNLMAVLFVA